MSLLREPNAEPIPGYRLIELIGSGGFGEVWKCEAPGGLHKAIKFVYGNVNSLDVDSVRADQERKALERIKEVRHPFVCSVERIDLVDGELIIVMELAEKTLHDMFEECKSTGLIGIPRDNLLRYMRDAAEALDHLNEKHKLQHLDVKPRNLFLISDRVKVADFGLVKQLERLGASGLLGGVTPLYAPPETFNGNISEHSDQSGLAIVYQELLTGHRPFVGKNIRQLAQMHLQGEPDLRALPEGERPVIAKALAKDPDKRFPSCMTMIKSLYNARVPIRVEAAPKKEPVLANANRPRTLADTLEDFQLEDIPPEMADEVVDLGSPPVPEGDVGLEVSKMGVTVAQPESGALRPTLFIGLGSFGRKALLELRCRFVDRFGDLSKIPLFRFLFVDSDPEAVNMAVRGATEVALTRNEVYHLPLQSVSNYRRRIIDKLTEWIPVEKLYSIPRSLQPQGSRALGRLAFVDNYQRLLGRLRKEIQAITNPEVIYQTVSETGLALRDNEPRIYIVAAGGGGSSGMLVDLGYALRRQLAHMRHHDAEMTLFLQCGAPSDPASPKPEMANTYATLTELNHFSDPDVHFSAEYGSEGQRIIDEGKPFGGIYLLPLAHRSPEAMDDVVSHLGSYIYHEVTTPLGIRLDMLRRDARTNAEHYSQMYATPFRSLGTHAVWFPRGLLLRLAARMSCRKLIQSWLATEESGAPIDNNAQIKAACEKLAADPNLVFEKVARRIDAASKSAHLTDLGGTGSEALAGVLSTLQEQSAQSLAYEDPGSWSRQALNRVRDWVGDGVDESTLINDWRRTKINRAFHQGAQKVAAEYAKQLTNQLFSVMENPGARVAAAESALDFLQEYYHANIEAQKEMLEQQKTRTTQCWRQLDQALEDCANGGGGFRFFGGRSNRRLLADFMDRLSAFARQRLIEEQILAVEHFFVSLIGQLGDQKRDLGFCRQRLRHLQENLDIPPAASEEDLVATRAGGDLTVSKTPMGSTEGYWEAIRHSSTSRVVLPDNEEDLERSAVKLLHRLSLSDWVEMDKEVHKRVFDPRGGLHQALMNSGDLTRSIAMPLMDETIKLLGEHLPIMDVAHILGTEFGFVYEDDKPPQIPASQELQRYTQKYLDRAKPLLRRKDAKMEVGFLLIPASQTGKSLGQAIEEIFPDVRQVRVPGQADLMFCRDQGALSPDDLETLFRTCAQAFESLVNAPQSSPHSRFDIMDWMPLDP